MINLALHHFSITDVDPFTLVDIAVATGCKGVCVFTCQAAGFGSPLPLISKAMVPEMLGRLTDKNIDVWNIDCFPILADTPFDQYRAGFEIGAQLGAKRAVTIIVDAEHKRASESLAKLADIATEYELSLIIEFMQLYGGCGSIHEAVNLINQADRANIFIAVDALHLARSGGTPEDVAGIDPRLIGSAQLCDGPLRVTGDYLSEAFDRQVPGEGAFPLEALVRALPPGTAVDVETPMQRLAERGVSAIERARMGVAGAKTVCVKAGVSA